MRERFADHDLGNLKTCDHVTFGKAVTVTNDMVMMIVKVGMEERLVDFLLVQTCPDKHIDNPRRQPKKPSDGLNYRNHR